MRQFIIAVLKRDLLIHFRHRSDIVNSLAFFVMVAILFPLAVNPEAKFLTQVAPGVIWVAALLACLLSIDSLFRSDFDDGCLEQMLISPQPLALLILTKTFSHWLVSGFCITLMSPLLAMLLFLPNSALTTLIVSLLLGTPTLSIIGSIGAALTVGLRKGGVLLSLLILPLYIPVLIFGTSAVQAAALGMPANGQLALLAAIFLLSALLAPIAVVSALRISVCG
jgi:heme exporter protein B